MLSDDGQQTVGAKRQRLLNEATADWVSFVDDDDLVSRSYVATLAPRLTDEADVVGFRLRYFVDGVQAGVAIHSYGAASYPLTLTRDQRGWKRFNRNPNHLNPTRLGLARLVGYKDLNYGEDGDYSDRLALHRPRETFVDAEVYDYLFIPQKRYQHWKA